MQSSSRGAKMVSIALNKQAENMEESQIQQNIPSAELNISPTSAEDPSVENGNGFNAVNQTEANLEITNNISRSSSVRSRSDSSSITGSSSRSSSSSNSSSSTEDNDDLLFDTSYVPSKVSNESDSDDETKSNTENCDTNNTDFKTPSTTGSRSPAFTQNASTSSNTESQIILTSPIKKGKKRKRNEKSWIRNRNKELRNSGKAYEMHTTGKKLRKERKMGPPCTEKCKVKCAIKFNEEERMQIFNSYWHLGDLEKQRQFIANSMEPVQPKYRYVRVGGTRKKRDNNNAFYFRVNGQEVRVCKLFFKNTLDINDRPIRTVQEKRNKVATVLLEGDRRGKHGQQKKIDDYLKEGVKVFIEKIPKIESHYTRANTSKHFIDGSKSIADIHRDYITDCKEKNISFVNYVMFYRIFTEDFNISFFTPKKDLCETCCAYDNTQGEEKEKKKEYYDQHLVEKELSRKEKNYDKEKLNAVVAVYDLQAVMQIPKGDVSVFYYKSKLNVLNFTIYDLKSNECECFFGMNPMGIEESTNWVHVFLII